MKQKFKRGDVVHIAKNLGSFMFHFDADEDVVIIGSYCDQFHSHGRPMLNIPERSIAPVADHTVPFDQPEDCCGPNGHSYTVLFFSGGTSSWYWERQLTFLRHGGEELIEQINAEYEDRKKAESDMEWIVTNWNAIRENPPGATMNYLMKRVGITEPWGSQGEGLAYYANAQQTYAALDEALRSGDIAAVERRIAEVSPLRAFDVRIGG